MKLEELASLPPTLTVERAAEVLGISRGAAYALAREGTLPGVLRLGHRYVVATVPLLKSIGAELNHG